MFCFKTMNYLPFLFGHSLVPLWKVDLWRRGALAFPLATLPLPRPAFTLATAAASFTAAATAPWFRECPLKVQKKAKSVKQVRIRKL
jgi:hypothetical protein